MAPYYGPNEDEATILLERYLVAADFVCGVGFGTLSTWPEVAW